MQGLTLLKLFKNDVKLSLFEPTLSV
ncbi:protein of unknown function [Bradyrhizobium vignae]|uniref:Uncharacterized protein n=1 Tax=Bradyrhizobium vignae TaxID=1549949 RepID=A0A2U3PR27_9BRAD|nr:protein of unknown function [Bradyrhizobium vignae]